MYTCEDEETPEIKCALRRRNPVCDESNDIRQDPLGQTLRMSSPRHGCHKYYRNREFCIYNVSMPQCTNGLRIESASIHEMDLYEDASCSDYLEFDFPGGIGRDKICGTDIDDYERDVTATSFLAVFWTDYKDHSSGFDLAVTCLDGRDDSDSYP